MMAPGARWLFLVGLTPLVSCLGGPPFEPLFIDGGIPDGPFAVGPVAFQPRLGRLEHHAPTVEPAPTVLLDGGPPDPALARLSDSSPGERQQRIGERVRTRINYAAGKQPIVVKVSPRPYAPLPQVERPLGAASSAVPRPVPGRPRPWQGSINGFRRPEDVFGQGQGLFSSGGSFGPGGSFGRPSSGRPGDQFPSRPRPVVRPGFVVRDNPPKSPPFPETVTGPPYRRPSNSGLREVYRPKPEGPFFVQGRHNPNRRGLLAEEVAVNAVGERPDLALVEVTGRTKRPSGATETPVSGGRLTARGPLDGGDGTVQITKKHTVARVQRPTRIRGSSDRQGRLLNGFATGALGFPPVPPSAPAPLLIGASTLEPTDITPVPPSHAVRFTDTLSLTLGGRGALNRPGIRVNPAGSQGLISHIRTAGPTAPAFLGTGPSVSLGPGSGTSSSRRSFTTSAPRSRGAARSRVSATGRPHVAAGPTQPTFLSDRQRGDRPSHLGVTRLPTTPHPLLNFISPSAAPFTASPFGSAAALTEGPTTFSLPNGQVSFPGTFGTSGRSRGLGFPTVTTNRRLTTGAGRRSFRLPNGQVSFANTPPRSHIPAGPQLPASMSRSNLRPSRRGASRVAGPALPFEAPPGSGSQQTFGTARAPFQAFGDPRNRRSFQRNSGLGLGRSLEEEFAAAFGTDAFLTGTRQQPTGFGTTGRFPNQLHNLFGTGVGRRGQAAVNPSLFPSAASRGRGLFTSPSGISGRTNGFPTTAGTLNNRGLFPTVPTGRSRNNVFSSPTGPSTSRGLFPTTPAATNGNNLFSSLTSPSNPLRAFPTTASNRRFNNGFGSTAASSNPLGAFSTTPSGRSTNGLFTSSTVPSTTLNGFATNPTLRGRGNAFTSPTTLSSTRGLFPTTPSSRRGLFTPTARSTAGGVFPTASTGLTTGRTGRRQPSTTRGFSDFDRGVTRAGPTMPGRRRVTEELLPEFDEEVRYFEPPGRQAALSDERLREASAATGLSGTSLALLTAALLRVAA